jgi:hypothetical protein
MDSFWKKWWNTLWWILGLRGLRILRR